MDWGRRPSCASPSPSTGRSTSPRSCILSRPSAIRSSRMTARLVALLGLITDQRSSAQTLLGFVRIAGYLIETNLFECQAPGAFMLRMRLNNISAGLTGQDCLLDGLIAIDEQGRIVGATRTGLNLLRAERHEDILSKKVEAILGVTIGDLRACASRGEPIELEIPKVGVSRASSSSDVTPRKTSSGRAGALRPRRRTGPRRSRRLARARSPMRSPGATPCSKLRFKRPSTSRSRRFRC